MTVSETKQTVWQTTGVKVTRTQVTGFAPSYSVCGQIIHTARGYREMTQDEALVFCSQFKEFVLNGYVAPAPKASGFFRRLWWTVRCCGSSHGEDVRETKAMERG